MRRSLPLLLLLPLIHPAPAALAAGPATLWVTQLGNAGAGSLRAAIDAANARPGMDRIRFARGLSGSIAVHGTALRITDEVQLSGPGADWMHLRGDGEHSIIQVAATAGESSISGLRLTNAGDSAIVNEGAMLLIDACTLHGNFGARGGAISSLGGDLVIRRSLLDFNSAEARGHESDGNGGGIHARNTSLTIESSRLSSNYADALGGGLYADLPSQGVLVIRNSVIDANSASTQGGGLVLQADAGPPAGILNSTISGNRSIRHAALWFDGPLVVNNSTIVDNYSPGQEIPGVCMGLCGAGERSQLWMSSSLLGGNRDLHGNGHDLLPIPGGAHVAHSLIERAHPHAIDDDRGGNLLNVAPRVGPLRDNGGLLPTHALDDDSPAIDAGSNPSLLQHDQRGTCHPRVAGIAPDIGAYEREVASGARRQRHFSACLRIPPRR